MRIKRVQNKLTTPLLLIGVLVLSLFSLSGCADVNVPEARNVDIPSPVGADKRRKAVNERPDSVMYLPLGEDVLVPEVLSDNPLPGDLVGPFELRNETLAGALQLILADYDISLAFETEEAFNRRITVANLHGTLDKVVRRVCSLADMYCSYEDAGLIVKDTQTFTVTLPPVGSAEDSAAFMEDISSGLSAVLGGDADPSVDTATRTLVYTATQRNAQLAVRYFQKLRANTAMIVFETYIWEVSLNAGNSMGIDWSLLDTAGKFNFSVGVDGAIGTNFTNPISIGLPTTQAITTPTDVVDFLSRFGAVKSISQPQMTVLSGSSAELRVAETENYVSEVTTTLVDGGSSSTSVSTDSVDSGFTLNIGSTWDKSTVYADISIELTDVLQIDNFVFSDGGAGGTSTSIQLPQTTERELTTQVRVRPGDSVLIAGLVQEKDNFDNEGPGFMEPVLPQSRTSETENLELVFLIRPRVVAYTTGQKPEQKAMKASPVASSVDSSTAKPSRLYNNRFEEGTASSSSTTAVPVSVTPEPVAAAPVPAPAPAVKPASVPEPAATAIAPRTSSQPVSAPPVAVAPEPAVVSQPAPVAATAPEPVSTAPPVSAETQVPRASSTYRSSFQSRYIGNEGAQPVRSDNSTTQSQGQNVESSSVIPLDDVNKTVEEPSYSSSRPAASSYSSSYEPLGDAPSISSDGNYTSSSSYVSSDSDSSPDVGAGVEVYDVNGAGRSSSYGTPSYSSQSSSPSSSETVSPSTYY